MKINYMLVALVCNCAGSVPLVRRFLSEALHPDPFSVPLYKGDEAKALARQNGWDDILAHLAQYSSYAILVGFSPDPSSHPSSEYSECSECSEYSEYVWADINLRASHRITAKVIVEEFA